MPIFQICSVLTYKLFMLATEKVYHNVEFNGETSEIHRNGILHIKLKILTKYKLA